jgi:hypothetical protein
VGRALAAMEAAPRDSDETPDSTVALALSDVPFRIGALPLMGSEGARIGRLAVGVSEADLERTLTSLLRLLGGAALIALFVAIGMALVFATRVSRPVKALAVAAQRRATGTCTCGCPRGRATRWDLMAAFNAMTVDLAGSRERVRGERGRLVAVARRLAHEIGIRSRRSSSQSRSRARRRGDSDLDEVIVRAAKTIKARARGSSCASSPISPWPRAAPRAGRRSRAAERGRLIAVVDRRRQGWNAVPASPPTPTCSRASGT